MDESKSSSQLSSVWGGKEHGSKWAAGGSLADGSGGSLPCPIGDRKASARARDLVGIPAAAVVLACMQAGVGVATRRAGTGLDDCGRTILRTELGSGDLSAAFHCWTLLTASSYRGGLVGTTESDLRAFTIHGCLSNFRAETRRLGSFWKHCMRKSRTAWNRSSR